MGQGDQCAASMALEHPLQLNGQTVSVGYEDLSVYRLLLRGVAVVVTDYVGLGTTDRLHTYVNRVDGAHAVLDAVRAARSLDSASVTSDSRVGLFGYSQAAAPRRQRPSSSPPTPRTSSWRAPTPGPRPPTSPR